MSLQSSMLDPVLGIDIHIVAMPAPPTLVPAPIPLPFVGLVFDPLGLLVGAAINLALTGGPGLVLINGVPVTNCGTSVTNGLTLPHLPAPGVAFLMPVAPVKVGDAELFFGSKDVSLGGSFGVRLGDFALSCSDPVRLPTSFVVAIPKGFPVLNMPPGVPDVHAMLTQALLRGALHALGALFRAVRRAGGALFRALREESQFWRALSTALGGCDVPASASRARTARARATRFVTGHPIDLVSGNLFTDVVDIALPGPLPLVIERVYESARCAHEGVLGHGWSHTLDEALFFERGRAVYRCGDGRELELLLFDLPDRTLRPGDSVERVPDRLVLRCVAHGRYEVEHDDGTVHELALDDGSERARLVRIRSEDGHHSIDLGYDERGCLAQVRDSGGRIVFFEHDARGRLHRLKLPVPHGRGWYTHRQYEYDEAGDLVRVIDAAGESYRYAYANHLLVQETDRTGASFYFEYDGAGQSARCVRTWGDGGIYDHIVEYDVRNRRTFVRDSLNAPKLCEYDARGLVTRIVDGEGRATKLEHDERSLAESAVVAPDGHRVERDYDAQGNVVSIRDGEAVTSIAYESRRPVRLVDPRGSEWTWRYDFEGHLVEHVTPDGSHSTLEWRDGLLVALDESGRGRVTFEHDDHRLVSAVVLGPDAVIRTEHDELGRVVKVSSPRGSAMRTQRDAEGRPIASWSLAGVQCSATYDAEGHLLASESGERRQRFEMGPGHRVVAREEAGALVRYEYDTECRLTGVVNEAGERYGLELNRVGETIAQVGFDGARRTFRRDVCGRPTKVVHASGRTSEHAYDGDRLVRVTHSDGTFVRFEHDRCGDMTVAENESARVEISYDHAGRVVCERVNGEEVRSEYANGQRVLLTTSRGARMSWLPDAHGHVQRVFFGADTTPGVTVERDALGVERARRFSNGIDHAWTRDDAGRVTTRRTFARHTGQAGLDAASTWLRGSVGPAPKSEIETIAYTWMGNDELARLVDSTSGAREYERDARGRLVRETKNEAATSRALDAVGNIFRAPDGSDRDYASGGRLMRRDGVRFEHDADGQRVREIDDDEAAWSYEWNGHGLLREVLRPDGVRVSFTYDAFARRIGKRTLSADGTAVRETRFVWHGNEIVHEDDSETGLTTWYWHPEDGSLLARERDGARWSVAVDHLGSPTEMHDARGELAWQMRLDAWGAADVMVGSADDCAWRWPGQYEDTETGLYYNRHRYYSPDDGRYISLDPIRLEGGLALYAYVEDPTGWIDPDGLRSLDQPGFTLYHIVNRRTNEVRYVGITDNLSVRRQAHIDSGRLDLRRYRIDVQAHGLTYAQVRGYEQADIGFHQTRRTGRIGEPIVAGDWNRVWSYAPNRTDPRAVAFRIFEDERRAYNSRGGCRG